MTACEFATRLGAKKSGDGWQARCPSHKDKNPSLSISESQTGEVLIHCHAGCEASAIVAACGLQMSDLFNGKRESNHRPKSNSRPSIVCTYDYMNETGEVQFQVCRFQPKDFRQRRPDGNGHWVWGLDQGDYVQGSNGDWYKPKAKTPASAPRKQFQSLQTVLFRLPELLRDIKRGLPVLIPEGEKDVETLTARGFTSTCNPGGASKWKDSYTETLRNADVIIIPDRDEAGRKHGQLVAIKLHGVASRVRVIELPDVGAKQVKDCSDYFQVGGDVGGLIALIDGVKDWTPPRNQALNEYLPTHDEAAEEVSVCAKPIGSLVAPSVEDELIMDRYLCKGSGMIIVGQSGQGKSALTLQLAILWSLNRPAFGLRPVRPLRTVILQAENDDGDLFEMYQGVCLGLELTDPERQQVGESVLVHSEDSLSGEELLLKVIEPLLKAHHPDILVIDPALAYVPGDTKDAAVVGQFLRRGLNPLLHRYHCAAIIVHHTTKAKADGPQSTHDFLYAASGSIEWSNWARAVLALETKSDGCYRLHAPKRGSRIGWCDANGKAVFDRYLCHSRTRGSICWHDADQGEVESANKSGKSKLSLLALVPLQGATPQSVLLTQASDAGIGQKKARSYLDELLADETLHLWLVRRRGTNAQKLISRHPQKEPELTPS